MSIWVGDENYEIIIIQNIGMSYGKSLAGSVRDATAMKSKFEKPFLDSHGLPGDFRADAEFCEPIFKNSLILTG